ncbi:cation:proton antiporter [Pelomonas sp. CA6]|uniref:cation:proton antiporter domain-containing protein n=1 Tax=Pelomonas sp. CA6 TaxID=2907999 RepID=UPI001F4C3EEA|nr:cation:proton antiporter [Pelomonas sp. CA6]MCH7343400.1 cation:proton antiporter [Pelomonas sp. CA6]
MNPLADFLQFSAWPPRVDWIFWATLILFVAGLLGEAVYRRIGLPRVVGYSVVGMLMAVTGHGLFANGAMDQRLRLVVDLALALLLFEMGSRVNLRWLRDNKALLLASAGESLLSFSAVAYVLWLLGLSPLLALSCAVLTVAASGAVIGRVGTELKAAGQVNERMLVLTALNTVYAVLAHRLLLGWLHMDRAGDWLEAVAQPLYVFVASVLLAAALARLIAVLMRRLDLRDENTVLMLLGLVLLALGLARALNLSTLLVPLLAGVVLRNTTARPWVWPRHFGTAGGVLVLLLFVAVGSAWTLQALAAGVGLAAVLLLTRLIAKGLALVGLARVSGIDARQGLALAVCLSPISGSTLVLFSEIQALHPEVAAQLAPIILSAIALMELAGPIAVQWGLRITGEQQPGGGSKS